MPPTRPRMTAKQFRAVRKKLGLRQWEAAELLGYSSQPKISAIENDLANAGPAVVLLMRAYLAGYRPRNWPKRLKQKSGR